MRLSGMSIGLAALLTLISFTSCIPVDPSLGSALVSSDQDITIRTATLDLPIGDSRAATDLQSRITSSVTVGSIGTDFYSEGLMSVTPATDSIVWGSNPTVQRVYLSLVRDSTLVLQEDQLYIPQNLYIHQLTFELDSTHVNGTLDRFKTAYYDPEPISLGGCVYTGDDAWSVDLRKEIGERLLNIPMDIRDSAELFMKQFYGFCIRTDMPDDARLSPDGEGRLNLFDLTSSTLYLVWDYTDDQGHRQRSTASFQLGAYYTLNIYRTLRETSGTEDGTLVVQGLNGNKPWVEASRLRSTVADWARTQEIPLENLVITKATVEFPFEYNGDRHQMDYYAASLFPCQRTVTDGLPYYAPISEVNETDLEIGVLDRSLLQYKSNISFYLQRLLKKDAGSLTDEDDLWFMPTLSYYNSSTGVTYYFADNVYYTLTRLNGMNAARHPVLKLTYTVLK